MIKKKTIFKIKYYSVLCMLVLFTVLLFLFSGCQEESGEITLLPSEQAITTNSAIAGYIRSIGLNDGSFTAPGCRYLKSPIFPYSGEVEIEIERDAGFHLDGGSLNQMLILCNLDLLFGNIDFSQAAADEDGIIRSHSVSNADLASLIAANFHAAFELAKIMMEMII